MEIVKKLGTKFNEIVIRTSVLEEMKGNYTAERLLRTWEEDFVDEDTGNVVTIQRNEILFDRGVLMDNDVLSQINFYLQSGDIKDVLASNQKRTGIAVKNSASVYCVTILQGTKKRNYYLYANSVDLALNIITDFLEQKIEGSFSFTSVKEMGFSNLIPLEDDDLDKDFYKIEVEIAYEEDDPFKQVYILQANDAEEAKEIIIKFISLKMKEEKREKPFETTIVSARTVPCNNIIDYQFAKEYFDND
ncbi:hypothetical protein [Flavobacterium sp. GT3P67]|uniref:hypothetical protein n=1 Tax=Flavobacterium sp. GT3P67 TaxID=2541722 RepID=UPI0010440DB9|nr:hypothetical protein [Flavobacterium sp. GT3P67]TDE53782.1 hypothetical protein E0H99_07130 [Flavobacterium sp. GT3P67]